MGKKNNERICGAGTLLHAVDIALPALRSSICCLVSSTPPRAVRLKMRSFSKMKSIPLARHSPECGRSAHRPGEERPA